MLLNPKERKKLEMLAFLYIFKFTKQPSLKLICNKFKIEKRTAVCILKELSVDLDNAHGREVGFIHVEEDTFDTRFPNSFDENILIAYYLQNSFLFKLLMDLLLGTFTTAENFSQKNFISVSTFYRSLPFLKKELKKMNIQLSLGSKEQLVGKEINIRYFYFYLLIDVYPYIDFPNLGLDTDIHFLDISEKLWLFITSLRIQRGFVVGEEDELYKINSFFQPYQDFQIEQKDLLHDFFGQYALSDVEYQLEARTLYIKHSLQTMTFTSYEELSKVTVSRNMDDYSSYIEKKSILWIRLFTKYFRLSLTDEQFSFLYFSLLIIHGFEKPLNSEDRTWFYGYVNNYSLISESSLLDKKIGDFSSFITTYDWFSESQESATMVSYAELLLFILPKIIQPVKITVYSKYGNNHIEYVKNLLLKGSSAPIEYVDRLTPDVQILISDFLLQSDTSVINIQIRPFMYEYEIQNIALLIETMYYDQLSEQGEVIDSTNGGNSMDE